MSQFDTITDEFHQVIEEVKVCLAYYSYSKELKALIPSSLNQREDLKYNNDKIKKILKTNLPQTIYHNSLFMILCASYEKFLTSILTQTIISINKSTSYSDLPEKLKNMNIRYTGSILGAYGEGKASHSSINYINLIKNLSSCKSDPDNFAINKEIILYVKGILNFVSFSDFLKKCELNLDILEFSNNKIFSDSFEGITRKKERETIAKTNQQNIYRTRNNIAHIGHCVDATPGRLKETLDFLKPFSASISCEISSAIKERYGV